MVPSEWNAFVSVDIETSGPIPRLYSLLAIGACRVLEAGQGFYAELKPQTPNVEAEAMAVHRLDFDRLRTSGLELEEAMRRFETWILEQVPAGEAPVFVSYNAPFDWMFIHDAFEGALGRNPFGHFPLDIRAFYMGKSGRSWSSIRFDDLADRYLGSRRLSHNALEDAQAQALLFRAILEDTDAHPEHRPAPRRVADRP